MFVPLTFPLFESIASMVIVLIRVMVKVLAGYVLQLLRVVGGGWWVLYVTTPGKKATNKKSWHSNFQVEENGTNSMVHWTLANNNTAGSVRCHNHQEQVSGCFTINTQHAIITSRLPFKLSTISAFERKIFN